MTKTEATLIQAVLDQVRCDLNDAYIRTRLHLEPDSKDPLRLDEAAIANIHERLERSLDGVEQILRAAINELEGGR